MVGPTCQILQKRDDRNQRKIGKWHNTFQKTNISSSAFNILKKYKH